MNQGGGTKQIRKRLGRRGRRAERQGDGGIAGRMGMDQAGGQMDRRDDLDDTL